MRIVATIHTGDVERGIREMERRAKMFAPAFQRLKKPLRDDQRNHAIAQDGPEGKWPPRKSKYGSRTQKRDSGGRFLKGKRGKRKPAGKLLGALPGATRYRVETDSVRAFSPVPWAGIHQEGGTAGRGAKIPARPFLWLSDALLRVADEVIAEHIAEPW